MTCTNIRDAISRGHMALATGVGTPVEPAKKAEAPEVVHLCAPRGSDEDKAATQSAPKTSHARLGM